MKKFYKENRVFSVLMLISITCVLIIFTLLILYFFKGQGTNKYGNRLEGIKEVKIANKKIKEFETKLKEEKGIKETSLNIQGRIIYIIFKINKESSITEGINASLKSLELFSEEEREYYDFNFLVDKEEKEEDEKFPVSGYKNAKSANIVWSRY